MTKKIAISQLGVLLYCEYKIYLKQKLKDSDKKVYIPVNPEMITGKLAHAKLKDAHEERQRQIETLPEELKPKEKISREVSVKGDILKGRMDEIEIGKNYIRIIDDKSNGAAYEGDQAQAMGYCMAYLQENDVADNIIVKAALRNYKTGDISWEEEYTQEWEEKLNGYIERYLGILDGSIKAIPTDNPARCSRCNLKKMCTKKAVEITADIIN